MKVLLGGEEFDYDFGKQMMSEAMAFEEKTGIRYAEWEESLSAGSLVGLCGLAWLIWYRNGREVPFSDITSGKADFDLGELGRSLAKAQAEAAENADHPTQAVPRTEPGGTATKRGSTRRS